MTSDKGGLLQDAYPGGPMIRINEPKFGEPIEIGKIHGKLITVCRPLNDDAFRQAEPVGIALLVMHDRMVEMQKQIDELKGENDT